MSDIDRIFSEKLTNWEKTPSDKAWEKINSNLGKKQKFGFLWYTVAASACLVVISTLFFILKDEDKIARIELPKIEKKPAITDLPSIKIASIDNGIDTKKPYKQVVPLHEIDTDTRKSPKQISKKKDGIFDEALIVSSYDIEEINSEKVVFTQEKEEIIDENRSYLITSAQPIEIIIKKGSPRAEDPKPDSVDKPRSKWGRAYEQMVNLKNGEKVNLREFSNLLALHKKDNETQNKTE